MELQRMNCMTTVRKNTHKHQDWIYPLDAEEFGIFSTLLLRSTVLARHKHTPGIISFTS
jgi:hypothetical protein